MSQDNTPSETASNRADNQSTAASRLPKQAALIVVSLSLFAVEPAAAQSNAVCSADNLPSMIEGFFQLTTALGIVGLAVVWQADSLIEMFTITPEQKKGLKRHTVGDEVSRRSRRFRATLHRRRVDDGPPAGAVRQPRPLVNELPSPSSAPPWNTESSPCSWPPCS